MRYTFEIQDMGIQIREATAVEVVVEAAFGSRTSRAWQELVVQGWSLGVRQTWRTAGRVPLTVLKKEPMEDLESL